MQVGTERGKVREYPMERGLEEKVRMAIKAIGCESVRLEVMVTEERCDSSQAAPVKKKALLWLTLTLYSLGMPTLLYTPKKDSKL